MPLIHLNESNFDTVIGGGKTVLVDFWATWCGPCRALAPIIEEIGEENDDFITAKVDVDDNEAIARKYSIASIPTLILFKEGQPVKKLIGLREKSEIMKMLK